MSTSERHQPDDRAPCLRTQDIQDLVTERISDAKSTRDRTWRTGKWFKRFGVAAAILLGVSTATASAAAAAGLAADNANLSGYLSLSGAVLNVFAGLGLVAAAQKRFALGNRWHALVIRWQELQGALNHMQDTEANRLYRTLVARELELRGEEAEDTGIAPSRAGHSGD
jgi:hypothetical protein